MQSIQTRTTAAGAAAATGRRALLAAPAPSRGGGVRCRASATDRVRLGESDLDVTTCCLGTMTWGKQNTEAEAHEQLSYAFERGINFLDTAEMYPVPPVRLPSTI